MRKNNSLYKRITALAVAVGMLFQCSICAFAANDTAFGHFHGHAYIPETTGDAADGSGETVESQTLDADVLTWFGNSVMVGDSIMVGFKKYSAKYPDSLAGHLKYLCIGSYSMFNALQPVEGDNVHPSYQGVTCKVEDGLATIGADRVFIMLGMNDLNISGLDDAVARYEEEVGYIIEKNPNIDINVMSMTYTLAGIDKGHLNNTDIKTYNSMLKDMCDRKGWHYLDMATPLSDGNGNLPEQYCSDGELHQTNAAYDVWCNVMIQYARDRMAQGN